MCLSIEEENAIASGKPVGQLDHFTPVAVEVGETATAIRKGYKWYDKLRLGAVIDLAEGKPGGPLSVVGEGKVTAFKAVAFKNIAARDVERHDNRYARTYSDLVAAAQEYYGVSFNEGMTFTVFEYTRTK